MGGKEFVCNQKSLKIRKYYLSHMWYIVIRKTKDNDITILSTVLNANERITIRLTLKVFLFLLNERWTKIGQVDRGSIWRVIKNWLMTLTEYNYITLKSQLLCSVGSLYFLWVLPTNPTSVFAVALQIHYHCEVVIHSVMGLQHLKEEFYS